MQTGALALCGTCIENEYLYNTHNVMSPIINYTKQRINVLLYIRVIIVLLSCYISVNISYTTFKTQSHLDGLLFYSRISLHKPIQSVPDINRIVSFRKKTILLMRETCDED